MRVVLGKTLQPNHLNPPHRLAFGLAAAPTGALQTEHHVF